MLTVATHNPSGFGRTAKRVGLLIFIAALAIGTAIGSIKFLAKVGVPQPLLLFGYVPALVMLIPTFYVLNSSGVVPFAFAGKTKLKHIPWLFLGVICYLAFELSVFAAAGVSAKVSSQLPFFEDAMTMPLASKLAFAFMVAVIAPLTEELFFRQLIMGFFPFWRGRVWAVIAVLVASVAFAFAHFDKLDAIGLTLFITGACISGWLRIWSGGILMPFLAHMFNNSLAVVALFTADKLIKVAGG